MGDKLTCDCRPGFEWKNEQSYNQHLLSEKHKIWNEAQSKIRIEIEIEHATLWMIQNLLQNSR